jgi:hypothetical protein
VTRALAYAVRGGAIVGPRGAAVVELDWDIPDHAVSVLLGPAGTGKSAIVRALTGLPPSAGWRHEGRWRHRGRPLAPDAAAGDIAWCPQRCARAHSATGAGFGDWRAALASGRPTVLLDEPTRTGEPASHADLAPALVAHRARGAVVLVTHDLSLARAVADEVCLLVAGRLHARAPAAEFFDRPPSELARRFLDQGNCWPPPAPPPLPPHFHWVWPGRLAGMAWPGLLGDAEAELEAVAAAGVGTLVSLTTTPFPGERLRPFGLTGRHFPIQDMGAPSVNAAMGLCAELSRAIERDEAVAVHCQGGLGRTGTMLAAMLVWRQTSPADAIEAVRAVCRGYIQSEAQLAFLHRFAAALT